MTTRTRWITAAVAGIALAMLASWQFSRGRLVQRCVASGGVWDGSRSQCLPLPGAPILQRDIRRS